MNIIIGIILAFLIIRFLVTFFNFLTNPQLKIINEKSNDLVSIMIPVRNEERSIIPLLKSIHEQDYSNYEVLILDDCSTDNTFNICKDFVSIHPKFTVIQGEELPTGWLGKNYACHQMAQIAKGSFFLFIDADEKVFNGLINSGLHQLKKNNCSLLSLFTNQEMPTIGEKLLVPLMNLFLLNLLPLKSILKSKKASLAAASGQFMLFNAAIYRQNNWHFKVKNKVVEDVEIMRLIKLKSLTGETLLANGMITCRMYNNFASAICGFSKNLFAGFNYNISVFLIYLILVVGGPLLIFTTLNISLIAFTLLLIILSRIFISIISQQSIGINLLLHPLQMISLLIVGVLSIYKYYTKTISWKGRRV